MSAYANGFEVLGDPTRRHVLELLRDGPRSVGEIAARLPISRPAVSQHLAALRRVGLVTYTVEGTRHVYSVDRSALAETRAWLDAFWDVALVSYAEAVSSTVAPTAAAPQHATAPGLSPPSATRADADDGGGERRASASPGSGKERKRDKRRKRKKKSRKERG